MMFGALSTTLGSSKWHWILYPVLAFLLAALFYGLVPSLDLNLPTIPSGVDVMFLCIAGVGLLIYGCTFEFLLKRPWWITFYLLLIWRLLEFVNNILTEQFHTMGIQVRITTFLVIGVPCTFILLRHFKLLWREIPWFKYLLGFLTLVWIYCRFYNAHFIDPNSIDRPYIEAGPFLLLNVFYLFLSIVAGYYGVRRHPNPHKLFNTINKILVYVSIIEGICCIFGYPLQMFTRNVDGYLRSEGFAIHPNMLAHSEVVRLLYFVGIAGYYKYCPKLGGEIRLPVVYTAIWLSILALVLALSKSSLLVFGLLMAAYLVVIALFFNNKKPLLYSVFLTVLLVPAFMVMFQLLTGSSFVELLESRIDNAGSFVWRTNSWDQLMRDIEPSKYLIGMGLTSSNEMLLILERNSVFNTTGEVLALVHNLTINLFHDMGLLGLLFYLTPITYIRHIQSFFRTYVPIHSKLLAISGILILLYITIISQVDEIAFSNVTGSGWVLMTFIYGFLKLGAPVKPKEIGAIRSYA
jgi:O-Antigen ligase